MEVCAQLHVPAVLTQKRKAALFEEAIVLASASLDVSEKRKVCFSVEIEILLFSKMSILAWGPTKF
jgi:hypothetical protein